MVPKKFVTWRARRRACWMRCAFWAGVSSSGEEQREGGWGVLDKKKDVKPGMVGWLECFWN
jgi:hypothetical protein